MECLSAEGHLNTIEWSDSYKNLFLKLLFRLYQANVLDFDTQC